MALINAAVANPNYGKGHHTIDAADSILFDERVVKERLLKTFHSPTYQPPMLPSAALQIMELAQSPDAPIEKVVALLESDPMLAAMLMKLLKSAVYAGRSPIRSIRQGVVRLGLNQVRDITIQVSMSMRVFRAKGYEGWMQDIKKHSVYTAYACRSVARYTSHETGYAFLCGLLHDVGIAAAVIALAEDVPGENAAPVTRRRGRKPENSAIPLDVAVPAVMGIHEEAGGLLARSWGLPAEIALVIANHEHPVFDGHMHPQIALVLVGEHLAALAGADCVPEGYNEESLTVGLSSGGAPGVSRLEQRKLLLPRCAEALDLDTKRWNAAVNEFREMAETIPV